MLPVAFLGIKVMVMGECHLGVCRDGKGVTVSGGTDTRWYHSHINQKYQITKY